MNLHGILNKGQGRRFLAAGAVTALGLVLSGAVATTAQADNVGGQMETICHRTGSADGGNQHNGYSVITVSINSIFKTKGHDSHNHIGNGPVGDIIPAFDYGNDQHYDGKNLTGNEDFLKNGCNNGEQPPPPHFSDLTLVKEVVNTGGGTELATAWTLDATGPTPFEADSTPATDAVAEGTYTLSESGPSGYSASLWNCDNARENGTTVTIGSNDRDVTCTITNTFESSLTSVTPQASATLGSCDAAGHVTLGDNRGYSWSENTGTANGPTYTAKANAGYKLIGTGVFTFHGLSQLPSTSPACLAPVVAGVVENAPVVAGVVENAPVVAGVVENAPAVKSLAFTGAETIPLGLSGLLALVLGAVLTVASRQRPKQARE